MIQSLATCMAVQGDVNYEITLEQKEKNAPLAIKLDANVDILKIYGSINLPEKGTTFLYGSR